MIASTSNPPQATQAQGGNPLVPFLNAGAGNVSGQAAIDPASAGLAPQAPVAAGAITSGPYQMAPAGLLGSGPSGAPVSAAIPGAPGAGNSAAQSGGGGGMAFGGLTSPYQPYSPIGNPIYRDPRKKAPQFAAVGMGQGQTNAPMSTTSGAPGMPGAGGLA